MWHFIKWTLALLIVVAVALLSLVNGQFVTINYLMGELTLPLSLVIFLSLALGVLLCAVWMLPRYYCLKWAKSNQSHQEDV